MLSTRRVLIILIFLGLFGLNARPIVIPDFWWHLQTGQQIVETRAVPHVDSFAYTSAGKEWVAHEWLAQAAMYCLNQAGGWGALIVAFGLLSVAALWVVYRTWSVVPQVAGLALLLGAFASAPAWGVNAQMFTIPLAAVFLYLLQGYARDGNWKRFCWMPLLMVLWVNLHGAYLLGPALVLAKAVGLGADDLLEGKPARYAWNRMQPLLLVAVACLFVIPLNPNGTRMYSYPFETLGSETLANNMRDWMPPDLRLASTIPFALLIFATSAAFALSPDRVRVSDLLMFSIAGLAGLRSVRHVPIFALIATPLLAEHAWNWLRNRRWSAWLAAPERMPTTAQKALHTIVLLLATGAVLVWYGSVIREQPASEAEVFPKAAVDFLSQQPVPQPLFHRYDWGGYLMWRLYPKYKVYIDGRSDMYGDAFIEEYFRTYRGRSRWRETLDRFSVRTAIVEPEAPIATLLRQDSGWTKIYEDRQAVIFTRR